MIPQRRLLAATLAASVSVLAATPSPALAVDGQHQNIIYAAGVDVRGAGVQASPGSTATLSWDVVVVPTDAGNRRAVGHAYLVSLPASLTNVRFTVTSVPPTTDFNDRNPSVPIGPVEATVVDDATRSARFPSAEEYNQSRDTFQVGRVGPDDFAPDYLQDGPYIPAQYFRLTTATGGATTFRITAETTVPADSAPGVLRIPVRVENETVADSANGLGTFVEGSRSLLDLRRPADTGLPAPQKIGFVLPFDRSIPGDITCAATQWTGDPYAPGTDHENTLVDYNAVIIGDDFATRYIGAKEDLCDRAVNEVTVMPGTVPPGKGTTAPGTTDPSTAPGTSTAGTTSAAPATPTASATETTEPTPGTSTEQTTPAAPSTATAPATETAPATPTTGTTETTPATPAAPSATSTEATPVTTETTPAAPAAPSASPTETTPATTSATPTAATTTSATPTTSSVAPTTPSSPGDGGSVTGSLDGSLTGSLPGSLDGSLTGSLTRPSALIPALVGSGAGVLAVGLLGGLVSGSSGAGAHPGLPGLPPLPDFPA
ncbi:hypothetical protein Q0O09_10540, partial [Corynebacterium bovis]|nr:hypothetical protein [Corynebacterium bovis]